MKNMRISGINLKENEVVIKDFIWNDDDTVELIYKNERIENIFLGYVFKMVEDNLYLLTLDNLEDIISELTILSESVYYNNDLCVELPEFINNLIEIVEESEYDMFYLEM